MNLFKFDEYKAQQSVKILYFLLSSYKMLIIKIFSSVQLFVIFFEYWLLVQFRSLKLMETFCRKRMWGGLLKVWSWLNVFTFGLFKTTSLNLCIVFFSEFLLTYFADMFFILANKVFFHIITLCVTLFFCLASMTVNIPHFFSLVFEFKFFICKKNVFL